jgi:DNA replication and repair protein RecF
LRLLWIELRDFRNHPETRLDVPEGLTAVVGSNGEGKTNLLEGMFYLLTLSSPRVSADPLLIRDGADAAYVRGETQGPEGRTLIEIEIRRVGANRVQVNRSVVRRKRDLRKLVRAVFFGPHDLRVVQGEPGARRDFLDEAIRALWPARESSLTAYERVLRQRNRLLKDHPGPGRPVGLETWNEELARSGAAVVEVRAEAVQRLTDPADEEFRRLSGYGLEVRYLPNVSGSDVAEAFLERLAQREADELLRRTTLVGPHRDDLHLGVRELTVRGFASHGEAWGAALSLRLALSAAVGEVFGEPPVLLVDDPFSALDPKRRDQVAEGLPGRGQVIVSVADEHDVPKGAGAIWHVSSGVVTERGGVSDGAQ